MGKMSLEEKVGQIMQAEIQVITPDEVRQYHIGSVLNGGGSMPGHKAGAQAADWLALADSYWEASMDARDGGVAIPIFWGTDAVHGDGNLVGATLFPHNIGLGAMHNPELIRAIGEATAEEVRATGVEWVFGPTLAVAQDDRWGRTYESYSEDPALVRQYAGAMVTGLQGKAGTPAFLDETHVIATAKHFLADGGTDHGDDQGNARVSEQTLVDIHNAGYPSAIAAGVQAIMASFSSWNGEKNHGNAYLLTEVLKQRMGFDGLVVGDWNGHGQVPGCTNDSCAQAINAGIDLVMVPYDWKAMYTNTLKQVRAGAIPVARLDDAVGRILRVKLRAGLFAKKPSARLMANSQDVVGSPAHRALARQAVRESLVLLKNHNHLLPLNPQQTILVAGPGADSLAMQSGGWSVSWQGVGIPNSQFPGATSIFSGIQSAVAQAGGRAILSVDGHFDSKPDVAIVVFGEQPYAEGQGDRDTLEFEPGDKQSLALLKSFKAKGIPVVSVFLSGRPLWVNPELNASDAFVAAWLPGTEGAGIADVIIAKAEGKPNYDFAGRLSFSWPKLPLQTDLNPRSPGYDPLFALGFGLNYAGGKQGPLQLAEQVPGLASDNPDQFDLFVGRPMQPWGVLIRDYEQDQLMSGSFAELRSGRVTVESSDKDVQGDALSLRWHDTWLAGLSLEYGPALDLSPFGNEGTLAFDLKVDQLAEGDLFVVVHCGEGCERRLDITLDARMQMNKGWQHKELPLACFMHPGDDFSQVKVPFDLVGGGQGQVAVANIRLHRRGAKPGGCEKFRSLSVTPARRHEWWSKDWDARWERNQARLKQGNVQLLMLGDSITERWESAGRKLWDKLYEPMGAVNLGYGGDQTQHLLWRLQNGELDGIHPKAAVVMIGTNNTGLRVEDPARTAAGVRAILDELRTRQPQMKILLLGVFPRDANPDGEMRKINNTINKTIAAYADHKHIFYLDIGDKFLDGEGRLSAEIMPDYLHPNERGYQIWAKAMAPMLAKIMQ